MLTPDEIAQFIVQAMDSKNARDIKLLRTKEITILADFFVLCTAGSTTQLKSLSDEVEKALKEHDEIPLRREGHRSGGWVLIDYGCVVVHLFLQEEREFYSLERLWGDAEDVDVSSLIERKL